MSALHDLTALQQGALVRAGDVSPRELVEHHLARLEGLDPRSPGVEPLGAFVTVTAEQALERADALLRAGRPDGAGPLWGVPTAIKDLQPTAGVRTTLGSPAFDDWVPERSDHVVLAMEAAGLVSLGKTSTPELGSPCYTEPEGRPAAVTPWDRTRMAGGSSGGAAAAVAAGLVPVAQGSDGGGSIRIPASCCGLVGLKPSRGRVSGAPAYGDPIGLATPGPLARTVRDAAALLDVLAGRRPGDPSWAPPPASTFLAACDRPPARLRVGLLVEPLIADPVVDPACLAAVADAAALLEALGHDVEPIARPLPREAVADFETCWAVLTALTPVPPGREHLLRPLTSWLVARGNAVSGPDFGRAIGALRRHAAAALEALAPYDVVLSPTLAAPPLPVGALRDDADPAADFEAQKRFTPWTSAWNVTGMPAVSLPLGWTAPAPGVPTLPVGVMLAARPAEDELLLGLAAQVESAAPWSGRRPPGW
ncbi:amidase [Nocardioides sp. TRM66260-LWL]|uniref:amidase n=1 Tax=Nocardioides sp. TRM66260-LWL TaxID=2874478 RepID=UPI001CC7E316|nr:amidase [Nocardioides sp. TRM66260-LWL]MBZ5733107.1 amidase [Nocardioides sp. TRM66260-LWL]